MADPSTIRCPQCGETLPLGTTHCAQCALRPEGAALDAYRSPLSVEADQPGGASFSLATLMAMVTILAAALGLGMIAPQLGILFFILCAPAYIRAGLILRRLRKAGATLRFAEDHVAVFLGSVGLFFASYVAVSVAAFSMCWVGFFSAAAVTHAAGARQYDPLGYGMMAGLSVGGLSGLGVLIWTGCRWWPVQKAVASRLVLLRRESRLAEENTPTANSGE